MQPRASIRPHAQRTDESIGHPPGHVVRHEGRETFDAEASGQVRGGP